MTVVIDGTTGISPVSASGTSASIDGMTVGRGPGELSSNTVVGYQAANTNSTGVNNTALGYQALYTNSAGYENTAVGKGALYTNTGNDNTAMGYGAMSLNSSGGSNTALGAYALQANTTASRNTAVGYQGLYTNSTGTYNVSVGYQAGYNATGNGGTFVGDTAGYSVTSGTWNTFIGQNAGYNVTTGGKNTIIGNYSGNQGGLDIRTASNYIVLSDGDGNPRLYANAGGRWGAGTAPDSIGGVGTAQFSAKNNTSGCFAAAFEGWYGVGINAPAGQDLSFMYFYYNSVGSPVGRIYTNGSTTTYATSSDYRLKKDIAPMTGALAKVALLKPCTYTWKSTEEATCGFIAHELQEVIPDAVAGEKDAMFENGEIKPQMVDAGSASLIATLTAAIQELNAKVDAQAAEIAALKAKP